ncbi:Smr/MutS family protein [Antarcticirhabdus aurantiaca]|uniref:Smr/MutS family protein n=1 Tax=Antarcticirhabdus aurantiaca TaxID=2606717 RepID=A0ACD4NP23_9HYPH|nr:Smr/MutS family protein [Antarcticirhabdus aurantiaca]WAJ28660.1 Smr/MutS family protein [Jeongeuplla avenae]
MKRRRNRPLSSEESQLWAAIQRSVTPLKSRASRAPALHPPAPAEPPLPLPPLAVPVASVRREAPPPRLPPRPAFLPPYVPPVDAPKPDKALALHPIERPVVRKLGRGRIEIDGRIDLHDMTQGAAHDALLGFLRRAQVSGLRHVLVVTGKAGEGPDGRGVIRRSVPHWFAKADFTPFVAGYESAERRHGGAGALYVRLRRKGAPR